MFFDVGFRRLNSTYGLERAIAARNTHNRIYGSSAGAPVAVPGSAKIFPSSDTSSLSNFSALALRMAAAPRDTPIPELPGAATKSVSGNGEIRLKTEIVVKDGKGRPRDDVKASVVELSGKNLPFGVAWG
jgi:hypothetical protein